MNVRQLEIFKAVMSSGSTTAAGDILAMSQSAISRQLATLEKTIGFALFHRDRGRLLPTAEAVAFLPEVRLLIDRMATARRRAEDLRAGAAGNLFLKVGFPHSLASTLLPKLVKDSLAAEPRLTLEVLTGPAEVVENWVLDRIADLGFLRLPCEDAGLQEHALTMTPFVCVIPPSHPLAARDVINLKDLSRVDLVLTGRSRVARRALEAQMAAHGARPRCRIECHSIEAACAFVAQGLGVSIVPELLGRQYSHLPIVIRPLLPRLDQGYGFVTLRGEPPSRTTQNFMALTIRLLAEAGFSGTDQAWVAGDATT